MSDLHPQQTVTYQIETTASQEQLSARERLQTMFENCPMPMEDKLFNIGMFLRSSVLVKFLVMSEIYQRVMSVPGCMVEFGTWWGQNLILLENLRAIHEPFNKQRIIIGFDTFDGYTSLSSQDKKSDVYKADSYSTGKDYVRYLEELLKVHERCNVLGHAYGRHKLIVGDVSVTAPTYFKEHPESIVAFAYFDMALYQPTKAALEAIKPHLMSGSLLLLDELTWEESPGEAVAFKEVFSRDEVVIEKCKLYPSKAIVTIR